MAVVSNIVGGTTPTAAVVVVRVDSGADVRVAVSSAGEDPTWFGPVTPTEAVTGHWVARVELTGLTPETRYVWHSEHDGVEDTQYPGQLDTLPPSDEPASYTVAVIGDAGLTPVTEGVAGSLFPTRMSNHHAFETVRAHPTDPLMVCHLGDLHYYNPGDPTWSGDALADYLRAWDDVLLQPRQHELYRTRAFQYMWDDHDYGPNDADGTHDGKQNAAAAYRLRAPHHTLAQTSGPVYHSFQIGRVLYVSSDTRYDRTPNSEPDTSNKTYLGAAQKIWLENLLSTTDAQVMVWLMPNPWLGTLDDTWGGFTSERQELADLLSGLDVPASNGARTWAESLVMASADVHAIGLWSSGANPYGGFPGILCASIDASPSQAGGGQYDLGFQGGRDQYATINVADNGATITLTLTAWTGGLAWGQQAVAFDAPFDPGPEPGPDPEPIPGPPPIAERRIERNATWFGIDDATGRVIAELPDMRGNPSRLLTAYTSSKLTYPLAEAGPGSLSIEIIEQATKPQRTSIVSIVNGLPVWAGRVLQRVGGSNADLTLAVASSEQYLLSRLVRAQSFSGVDRALVANTLLSSAGSTDVGPGMALDVDVQLTGDLIDRDYLDTDLLDVYTALRDLAAGGLEWTIDLDFETTAGSVIRRIMRIGPRIGRVGTDQVPLFATKGEADVAYQLDENYTTGRYANVVTAYGSGQGEDMPLATVADTQALDSGAPVVHRTVYARDVTDTEELARIAQTELDRLKWGSELWDLDALFDAFPRLGYDVALGDDANWNLKGPRHPDGVTGSGRVIGWELDIDGGRWNPKLLDPHEEVV